MLHILYNCLIPIGGIGPCRLPSSSPPLVTIFWRWRHRGAPLLTGEHFVSLMQVMQAGQNLHSIWSVSRLDANICLSEQGRLPYGPPTSLMHLHRSRALGSDLVPLDSLRVSGPVLLQMVARKGLPLKMQHVGSQPIPS